jgi:hypothetical protein
MNSIVGIVVKKLVTTLKYKIASTPILEELKYYVIHLFVCKTWQSLEVPCRTIGHNKPTMARLPLAHKLGIDQKSHKKCKWYGKESY